MTCLCMNYLEKKRVDHYNFVKRQLADRNYLAEHCWSHLNPSATLEKREMDAVQKSYNSWLYPHVMRVYQTSSDRATACHNAAMKVATTAMAYDGEYRSPSESTKNKLDLVTRGLVTIQRRIEEDIASAKAIQVANALHQEVSRFSWPEWRRTIDEEEGKVEVEYVSEEAMSEAALEHKEDISPNARTEPSNEMMERMLAGELAKCKDSDEEVLRSLFLSQTRMG